MKMNLDMSLLLCLMTLENSLLDLGHQCGALLLKQEKQLNLILKVFVTMPLQCSLVYEQLICVPH